MTRDALLFTPTPAGQVWLRYHPEYSARIQLMRDDEALGSYHSLDAAVAAAAGGETVSEAVNSLPRGTIPSAVDEWQPGSALKG
jgi:hypothetical protein